MMEFGVRKRWLHGGAFAVVILFDVLLFALVWWYILILSVYLYMQSVVFVDVLGEIFIFPILNQSLSDIYCVLL